VSLDHFHNLEGKVN
jgi:TolA-binding protein